jgi:peroxiredoxin
VAIFAAFAFSVFVESRRLPPSHGAPQVGQKALEFALLDTNGRSVSLADLLTAPIAHGRIPKGVLLVFYRGYW